MIGRIIIDMRSIGRGISNKGCYSFPAWGLIVCLFIQLTLGTEAATNQTAHAVVDLQLRKPTVKLPAGYDSFLKDGLLWQGDVLLHGRKWWLGAAERLQGQPLSQLNWLFFLQSTDRDGAPVKGPPWVFYALKNKNLTLNNHTYRLSWALDGTGPQAGFQMTFNDDQPAMGELKVEGTDILRLQFHSGSQGNLVLVENPGPTITLPVDRYSMVQVTVGKTNSAARFEANLLQPLEIASANATVLRAGGPLTNRLSAQWQGRSLRLDCQLLGAEGHAFRSIDQNLPPSFTVSRNGRTIHQGSFEFG
jgi:hypothetical protein